MDVLLNSVAVLHYPNVKRYIKVIVCQFFLID
jgi:hypothetical protein